jgi:nucleotide-binding universal stress UspA family protein
VASGPIVIAFDGSPEAERAVREAPELLAQRRALVVVVAKLGIGFDAVASPSESRDFPPPTMQIRTAAEVDEAVIDRARRLASRGAELASEAGLDAESMVVADEVDVPVAETLVDVARRSDAPAIVTGAHRHGGAIGPVTRDLIRLAQSPVLVRGPGPAA